MSIYHCPKGHESTESDFCSECGAKIQGAPEEIATVANLSTVGQTPVAGIEYCPDCATPRDKIHSSNFCEICGYNFVTGGHGEVPVTTQLALDTTEIALANLASVQAAKTIIGWEIIVTIDPSLRDQSSPDPPTIPPIVIRLNQESNLIGRYNDRRGINPEIALDFDDAISHRHALLNRQLDGSFVLRDIGSTNGTKINGVDLEPLVDIPLKDGDEFTLGHWTRIAVQAVYQPSVAQP